MKPMISAIQDFLGPMARPLTLILIPAAAALVGGVLVEFIPISKRFLSFVFHFSSGVLMGIIGVELIPEFLKADTQWIILLMFVIGGGFFLFVDWATEFVNETIGGQDKGKSPYVVFLGLAVDLVTDGVLIASGSTIQSLGFPLAIATAIVALPEGFTAIASLKRKGIQRGRRILLEIAQPLLMIAGVPLGFLITHGRPPVFAYSAMAFTAGFLAVLLVEEIVPRSHRGKEARLAAALFVLGFIVVAAASDYLG